MRLAACLYTPTTTLTINPTLTLTHTLTATLTLALTPLNLTLDLIRHSSPSPSPSPSTPPQRHWTPLRLAAYHGHIDIVKQLLRRNVQIELKDHVRGW